MLITTMYKAVDRQVMTVSGHLNKQEISSFKADGWRLEQPQINKTGIPVQTHRRKHS
ncbi:hypothetical protein [Psychrobacillus sp. NPDC093200]|uniref:hypothetical protein n=1 Tax=Psychrobacillus sp. NPDC093200 TaxID=3390656 RepID=UPI003D02FB71